MEKIAPCNIAVVGVSTLFPGSVDKEGFWNDIFAGKDLISEVPPTHWLPEDYYDANPSVPDKTYTTRGGFISNVEFDPMEFGIVPKNIPATDVSQLLALVVAKQVLNDATNGQFRHMDRSKISVMLGMGGGIALALEIAPRLQRPVWAKVLRESGLSDEQIQLVCDRITSVYPEWNENILPGTLANVVAGRIANRFDLGGTSAVVDSACASSLSAMSMAMMELMLGKSDLVITGGVEFVSNIYGYMCFSKTSVLSPTGNSRPFSNDSDGMVLGEGVGMVALKRLEDAERDGDRIYAVIKGIGSSSDGYDKSIYAPRAEGEAQAIRRAYEAAGYSPRTVELIEAHATGTKVGEVVEVQALSQAFDDGQPVDQPWCGIGSVKSQIGHTRGAAGAAGLIKAVMALHHKVLPPTIKVNRPNPQLAFDTSPFYVNTRTRPWIRNDAHPRRGSVSAFGFGGTNFHVALEEYQGPGHKPWRIRTMASELFVWSGGNNESLLTMIKSVDPRSQRDFVMEARRSQETFDVLQSFRLAIVATDAEQLQRKLQIAIGKVKQGEPFFSQRAGIFFAADFKSGSIGFLFPGQGSQYVDMGTDVTIAFDSAREVWDRAAAEGQLHQLVFPPPVFSEEEKQLQSERLARTECALPAVGVTSHAIFSVLRTVGVEPQYVAGISLGEFTALFVAGVWDENDFLKVACKPGELLLATSTEAGAMAAVFADRETVAAFLKRLDTSVAIASCNSPNQLILSGRTEEMVKVETELTRQRIRFQRLNAPAAFHCECVASSVPPFREFLNNIQFNTPRIPVYSNVTGEPYPNDPDAIREAVVNIMDKPTWFEQQLRSMYEKGVRTFVEVGPQGTLTGLVRQCFKETDVFAIATDRKGTDGVTSLWNVLGQLSVLGVSMNLGRLWEQYEAVDSRPPASKSKLKVMINGANDRNTALSEGVKC